MPTDDNLQGAEKSETSRRLWIRRARLTTTQCAADVLTGWNNYMMNLGKMMGDAEAMKRFGNTVVIWDLHTRKPKKVLVPVRRSKSAAPGALAQTTVTAASPPRSG